MFEGGKVSGKGQFESSTGTAVDGYGKVFIADTGNHSIEKFSPTGEFVSTIKIVRNNHGQSSEPSGIAVDHVGYIYVADASNQCVEKLAPDGTLIAEWNGPDSGFYGPRRIAIGRDDSIYLVARGRTRIVKFSPDGRVLATWGSKGKGDGQFDDPTQSQLIPRLAERMSPTQLTDGYRYWIQMVSF